MPKVTVVTFSFYGEGIPLNFGGAWTEKKKKAVQHYLRFFAVALKNKAFSKYYIDAFAGTGYRHFEQVESLFEEGDADEMEDLHRGSALIALENVPAFDQYFFIEINPKNIQSLKEMASKYPDRNVDFIQKDANEAIKEICNGLVEINIGKRPRCVVFLDPFGTEVKWTTLEQLAKTKVCDIWYLFPTNAINRMLKKRGKIHETWENKLNAVFGDEGWKDYFYKKEIMSNLFTEGSIEESSKVTKPLEEIQKYVYHKLTYLFGYVGEKSLPLYNSKSLLFSLFFAMSSDSKNAHEMGKRYWDWLITKDSKGGL